jgi:hypothetical protein
MEFDSVIINKLLIAKNDRRLLSVKTNYKLPLEKNIDQLDRLDSVHNGLKEVYTEIANGFKFEWKKEKKGFIGGSMNLIPAETIFGNWKDDEWEIEQNENIQYFKPFDLFVPEAECGFIITPEKVFPSIYYHELGEEPVLYSLDLDFKGYCQMAIEARIYTYWQLVILSINGSGKGEAIAEDFKKDMPEIFPDFSWDNFIERYNSLRLSNQK